MKANWIYLSHILNNKHYAYGNGKKINIKEIKSIANGDTSNNSEINLPTHFGTHIDYPYHFNNDAINGDYIQPSFFISNNIEYLDKSIISPINYLYTPNDFKNIAFNKNTEILIIKTGIGKYYNNDIYWNSNPGFSSDLADFFKSAMPKIKIFGFDSISLTARKFRDEGKQAHKKFLIEHNILILEDMFLNKLNNSTIINNIIIAPLRFQNEDGAPVTIFAQINEQ